MEEYVWISKVVNHPVFTAHAHPILKRLESEYGVRISIEGSEDASATPYIQAVHEAIRRKVAGIMIIGWEDKEIISAVNDAVAVGIPVVCVDSDIVGSKRLAYVGTDWYSMGQAMADKLARMINGPGKILMLGIHGLDNMERGFRGFSQRIKSYPGIQLLGPENDIDVRFDKAEAIVSNYLKKYPDLAGIAGFDGNSGPGAAQALEKHLKIKTVRLVSVDAEENQLKYVRSGVIDATFAQKREYFTCLAFHMLYSYNHGSVTTNYQPGIINIPGNIDTGFSVVTKENVDSFEQKLYFEEAIDFHKLSHQMSMLTGIIDNIRKIILVTDVKGQIVFANPASLSYFGYDLETIKKKSIKELFAFEAVHLENFAQCINIGSSSVFKVNALKNDRSLFPVQLTFDPWQPKQSLYTSGVIIFGIDISGIREMEQELVQARQDWKNIFQAVEHSIVILDPEGRMLSVNKATEKIVGVAAEKLIGKKCFEVFHNTDTFIPNCPFKKMLNSRKVTSEEMEIELLNRNYLVNYTPVLDTEGRLQKTIHVLTDITKQKEVEKNLIEERNNAQKYLDVAGVIFVAINSNGEVTLINKKGCEILEYAEDEIIGVNWFENFLPQEMRNNEKTVFAQLMKREIDPVEYYENSVLTKNANKRVIAWQNTVLKDDHGKIIGALSSGRDVTEQTKTFNALMESEHKYHSLYFSMSEGFALHRLVYDKNNIAVDYVILDVNPAFEVHTGIKRNDALGVKASVLYKTKEAPYLDIYANVVETGQPIVFEKFFASVNKHFHISVFSPEKGMFATVFFDVTARKRAEERQRKMVAAVAAADIEKRKVEELRIAYEELRKMEIQLINAEKLSGIGLLAAGVAHELNSPLAGILSMLRIYSRKSNLGDEEQEEILLMIKASEHMAKIIQDLISFAKVSKEEFELLDINTVIESTLSFSADHLTKNNIEICKFYSEDSPKIKGNRSQLQQVVLNMITNARDAMSEGGEFTILTRVGEKEENIFIEFSDTGCGIKKEHMLKIFDPFFTTKEQGEGVGLGLSVSFGIIKNHNGKIEVESIPGQGAKFTVILPIFRRW